MHAFGCRALNGGSPFVRTRGIKPALCVQLNGNYSGPSTPASPLSFTSGICRKPLNDLHVRVIVTRTYLNNRHVCDGGDVGCSFRRRTRSNMSILQGFPTPKCTPERSLRDRGRSLPQWARNGRRPLLSAPSLRVAARTARGGRSSACARGRRCDPAAGQARRIEPACLCAPLRSHPRKPGPLLHAPARRLLRCPA